MSKESSNAMLGIRFTHIGRATARRGERAHQDQYLVTSTDHRGKPMEVAQQNRPVFKREGKTLRERGKPRGTTRKEAVSK